MKPKYFVTSLLRNMVPKSNGVGASVRVIILGWSAGLLTASYAGLLPKMDPTFIASILTASLATFGVDAVKKTDSGRSNFPVDLATAAAVNTASAVVKPIESTESVDTGETDGEDTTSDTSVPQGRV